MIVVWKYLRASASCESVMNSMGMRGIRFNLQFRSIMLENVQPAGWQILVVEFYADHALFLVHVHHSSNPDHPGDDSVRFTLDHVLTP